MTPAVSIVIPVHNEEAFLPTLLPALHAAHAAALSSFEIILVENGSTDRTRAICQGFPASWPVRVLTLDRADYGAALRAGMEAAQAPWIVNYDLDYHDLKFTQQILALAPFGYDVIVASKNMRLSKDERAWFRRLVSGIYKYVLYYGFGLQVSDTHGIKAWRNDHTLRDLIRRTRQNGEIFDSELIIRSQRAGRTLLELPTELRDVRSSVTHILPRAFKGLRQICSLWVRLLLERR